MDLFFIRCRATPVLAFGIMKGPNLALSEDRRVAVERGARGAGDFHGENLAAVAGGPLENDDLVRAGAPRPRYKSRTSLAFARMPAKIRLLNAT